MRIAYVIIFSLLAAFGTKNAFAMCAGCDVDHFLAELSKSEGATDSCDGGGGYYTCLGPELPESSSHAGDRPMGLYQMMPNTAIANGCISDKSEASIQGFLNDPAAQDACAKKELENIYNYMSSNGIANGGGGFDCGALVAAGWLGGPGATTTVADGGATADQVYTSHTTADKATAYNGVCAGGSVGNGVVVRGSGEILGCDQAVLEQGNAIVDTMNERDMQVAKSMITQPTPIEQTTCLDQHIQTRSTAGATHAAPDAGNISGTMGPLVEQPFIQNLISNFMSENAMGSLQSMINNSYTEVVQDFQSQLSDLTGGLGGLLSGGGSNPSNCDMMNDSWLLAQCIQMPKFPSVNEILNGAVSEVTGAVNDVINSPFEALENVCHGMSDKLGDFTNSLIDTFENAADKVTSPITDTLGDAAGNIGNVGTN